MSRSATSGFAAFTAIWAAGVQASPAAEWLGAECDRAGRVLVGEDLRVARPRRHLRRSATRACAGPDGRPLPGVAPVAKQQGRYVADADHRAAPRGPFRYRDYGNLATIGRRAAVIDFGRLRMSRLRRLAALERRPHLVPGRLPQPHRRRRSAGSGTTSPSRAARASSPASITSNRSALERQRDLQEAARPDRPRPPGRRRARRLSGRRLSGAARGRDRARLGDRHLDRRDQRRRSSPAARTASGSSGSREFWRRVEHGHLIGGPAFRPGRRRRAQLAARSRAGIPAFFRPNPAGLPQPARAARRRGCRLLFRRPAPRDARASWSTSTSSTAATTRLTVGASNVRTSEMRYFDSRDMPLDARACHGVGRAAAGLPGGPHRRRALLGRRHPLEHAGRGRVRRQSAPQLDGLRGPYLEPARRGAGDDLGGDEPPEGRPIFEPRRMPTSSASASSTGCATSSPSWRKLVPEDKRGDNLVGELAAYGCLTRMHVVRLLAPALDLRGSRQGHRLQPGRHPPAPRGRLSRHDGDARARRPGARRSIRLEGFILHEACGGEMIETARR